MGLHSTEAESQQREDRSANLKQSSEGGSASVQDIFVMIALYLVGLFVDCKLVHHVHVLAPLGWLSVMGWNCQVTAGLSGQS